MFVLLGRSGVLEGLGLHGLVLMRALVSCHVEKHPPLPDTRRQSEP